MQCLEPLGIHECMNDLCRKIYITNTMRLKNSESLLLQKKQ